MIIDDPCILIRLNLPSSTSMTAEELYKRTRSKWVVNPARANKAKYGMAVFEGTIIEVYEITKWTFVSEEWTKPKYNPKTKKTPKKKLIKRYEFKGELAFEAIRDKYNNQSVKHLFKKGNSNPINYQNI